MGGGLLYRRWKEIAASAGERTAVDRMADGKSRSFGDIDGAVDRLWKAEPALQNLKGAVVAFAAADAFDWFCRFLALQKIEAVALPLEKERVIAQQAASTSASWIWGKDGLEHIKTSEPPRSGCLIKLTSGSTGAGKQLAVSAEAMLADCENICAGMAIGPRDVNYAVIPLGHSYGLGNLVLPLIAKGIALVEGRGFFPAEIAMDIARARPTVFPAVPVLLRALAEADIDPENLQSLRLVISAGAPLPPSLARQFYERFGHIPRNFYGSSETGGIAFNSTGESSLSGSALGMPLPGVFARSIDDRTLEIRSGALCAEAAEQGSFSLPDQAQLNNQGEIVLLGRAPNLVKIGGRRLDLREVEAALRELDEVEDVHALRLETARGDVVAAVCACPGGEQAQSVRKRLATKLEAWKRPRLILAVKRLPHTGRGKLDTAKLAEMVAAEATKRNLA